MTFLCRMDIVKTLISELLRTTGKLSKLDFDCGFDYGNLEFDSQFFMHL